MKQILFSISLLISAGIYSQNDAASFDQLVTKESSVVSSLFSYPDSVYSSILMASVYPQGFVRLNEIQKTSSDSFKKIISTYSQGRQKQLWEITRYPQIISIIIENKDKQGAELDELLKKYPAAIKKSAINIAKSDYSTLLEIDKIHRDFETKYKEIINDYPNIVKSSYNLLIGHPEIVTMLSENNKTAVDIGELYKRNPKLIKQKADSLNFETAKEKGIEYEEWKRGIVKDTAVQRDLKEAAKDYSNEEKYDDDIYARANDKLPNDKPEENTKTINEVAPYPYWAGYPYWYGRNYWYPYPWWYQTGFYWPLYGPLRFYGLPSYNFGWWYYNHPHHYYDRHPNSTNYFRDHYQGRRNSNGGFNRSTREFNRGRRK